MDNFLTPVLFGMVGTGIVYMVLPTVIALGLGFMAVGLIRRKAFLVLGGIALPLAFWIVGVGIQSASLANENAPANLAASMSSLEVVLPYASGFAVILFLVKILPAIIRVAREKQRS